MAFNDHAVKTKVEGTLINMDNSSQISAEMNFRSTLHEVSLFLFSLFMVRIE